MKIERIKIRRAMRGEDGAAWAAALADPAWLAGATVLKDEPGSSWVRRGTMRGREVVVKCRLLNRPSRWIKAALGYGHGDKHWRGAALLASKKIATAVPIVHANARADGVVAELLLLEYLSGSTLLELMRDAMSATLPVRAQHAIAHAVGRQVAHCGWVFNRDHKPSNLIVMGARTQAPTVAIIDCGGVRFRQVLRTERMFASLVIEPMGCGVLPRRALLMRALEGRRAALAEWYDPEDDAAEDDGTLDPPGPAWDKRLWRDVQRVVEAHGDPRPKIDPLRCPQPSGH